MPCRIWDVFHRLESLLHITYSCRPHSTLLASLVSLNLVSMDAWSVHKLSPLLTSLIDLNVVLLFGQRCDALFVLLKSLNNFTFFLSLSQWSYCSYISRPFPRDSCDWSFLCCYFYCLFCFGFVLIPTTMLSILVSWVGCFRAEEDVGFEINKLRWYTCCNGWFICETGKGVTGCRKRKLFINGESTKKAFKEVIWYAVCGSIFWNGFVTEGLR